MPFLPKRDHPFYRLVTFLIGLGACYVCAWQLQYRIHLLQVGVRTTGHALPHRGAAPSSESGAHPDIAFPLPDGRTVQYNQNGMGSRPVGTPIPIVYDPARPAQTAISTSFWQFGIPVVLSSLFGAGFTAAAIWGEIEVRGPGHWR